jgi:hypothetical protein
MRSEESSQAGETRDPSRLPLDRRTAGRGAPPAGPQEGYLMMIAFYAHLYCLISLLLRLLHFPAFAMCNVPCLSLLGLEGVNDICICCACSAS